MSVELSVEKIARVAHEANRAWCAANGDLSHLPWDEAPAWQKHSAREGVKAHLKADLTPRDSHTMWLGQKARDGWVYGPVKNETYKEHPCMVPYDELPPEQRIKDALFSLIVRLFKDFS